MQSGPSSAHQYTFLYSHQHVLDDFTDYSPLTRAQQILPEINIPRPSALCVLPDYCWGNLGAWFYLGLVLGRLQAFLLEPD